MKIQKDDKVKVISGKDKGKTAKVEKVYLERGKILVEGVNIVTKHMKPTKNTQGGIIKVNRPIDVSNVMLICSKCSKTTRVEYKIIDGKKYRICKKCSEPIQKS